MMFKKIISIGISPDLNKKTKVQIEMLNGIAITSIIIVIIYSLIHILTKDEWFLIVTHHLLYIIISLSILFFNKIRKYDISIFAVHIGFPVSFMVSCMLLGEDYHVEYLLTLTAIGSIFIFKNNRIKYVILGFNIFLLTFINLYYAYFAVPIVKQDLDLPFVFNYFTELVLLLMIYIIVRIVFQNSRKLNKKLKNLSANQEKIIQERTVEIEEKSKALKQSNHELQQFAYISAHDMREPLRNIMGFSQLLSKDIDKSEFENVKEYIELIKKSVFRLDRITKDIVNYTEIEKYINETEVVNLTELVENITLSLKSNSSKAIEFEIKDLPTLHINPKLCQYIFYNLLENAIQYTDKSPVKIKIDVSTLESEYQFSIKDNGFGIAPEYFEKIFGMFKRLHNDISKSGSGIGLSICKKILTNYGGKIWIESEIGKGSTFYFTLPK